MTNLICKFRGHNWVKRVMSPTWSCKRCGYEEESYTKDDMAKEYERGVKDGDAQIVLYLPWKQGRRKDAYHGGEFYEQKRFSSYKAFVADRENKKKLAQRPAKSSAPNRKEEV